LGHETPWLAMHYIPIQAKANQPIARKFIIVGCQSIAPFHAEPGGVNRRMS
jgi:hypothetical protein